LRFIGLDVHLDFCEIAICENGKVRSAGRVPSSPAGIDILVRSLNADDQVALEATGNALQIARLVEPHVARVVVAPTKELSAITTAKVLVARRGHPFAAAVAEPPCAAGPAANAVKE
jgi:transposase